VPYAVASYQFTLSFNQLILLENIMGLEKVVLDKLESVDTELADGAYFKNGTLWIPYTDTPRGRLDVYRAVNALKEVVSCALQTSLVGNEVAVDFV